MSKTFSIDQPTVQQAIPTTLIEFILDETGSMSGVRQPTIDGFNEYVNSQKNQPGNCLLSLTQFDQRFGAEWVRNIFQDIDINTVSPLTTDQYQPHGSTNLYDAIGTRINALANRSNAFPDSSKLIVIMTDGVDNASKEFTADSLKTLITQKETEGWSFVFLGANQDAWKVGQTFGIAKGNAMTYEVGAMADTMMNLSAATSSYRSLRNTGLVAASAASTTFFNDVNGEKNDK